jgi:uncharacterized protein with GYD domain
MPKFMLMTTLDQKAHSSAEGRRTAGKQWLKKVRKLCPGVKWIAHYAILGPYDFVDIYEAPDVETAHKVSLISRSAGARTAESWQVMDYDSYLKLLEDVNI